MFLVLYGDEGNCQVGCNGFKKQDGVCYFCCKSFVLDVVVFECVQEVLVKYFDVEQEVDGGQCCSNNGCIEYGSQFFDVVKIRNGMYVLLCQEI